MASITDWLFTWKFWLSVTVILMGSLAVGIVYRGSTFGNVASTFGLSVSVLGFVVTIWTVWDARLQIKEAGERAERAIAEAKVEVDRAVNRIAAQLRAADCAALRTGVEDLRQAAQETRWHRATYRCQECRVVAYRLAHDPHLTGEEASSLRSAADDLQLIQRFIESNRMTGQPGPLQRSHMQCIDGIISRLAQIQGRLYHEAFQPIEMPSHNPC